jgi:hypothetical protein
VRLEERRLLKFGLVGGGILALIPVLYLTFLLVWGSSLTPRPTPSPTPAPPLISHALWARAGGGRATELRAVNPINVAGLMVCSNLSGGSDDAQSLDAESLAECAKWLPALQGLEYLSSLHSEDHQIKRASFRGGATAMATMLRLTYSWTREEFLNTLAAQADFGYGWKGTPAAARGFFGRSATDLTLAQSAFLASRVGDTRTDPWCEPAAATAMRNRVLDRMRINGAISETDFQVAQAAELGLAPPAEGRPACKE